MGFVEFQMIDLLNLSVYYHNQYVFINGYDSGVAAINCCTPQGSALGSLPLLLYISDLNQATIFFEFHHFADDNNLLYV